MSSYVKSTNFSSKDSLPSGNPGKIVKGTEIDTEFNNIATAVNSKADSANPVFTGVVEIPDGSASAPSLTNTGDTNTGVFFPAGDTIGFANGGSETARIDSSGNLGLGVTPSAWSGSPHSGRVLQTGGAAFFGRTDNSDAYVSTNAYRDATNWKYIATAPAAYYHQSQNTHLWFIAPSGTAGNAITWTEAMRLDTSGNLGVGTTSPSSFGALCTRRGISVAGVTGSVSASFSDGTNDTLYVSQDSSLSRLTFATLTFNTGTTERARYTSGGDYLVGSSSTVGSAGRIQAVQASSTGSAVISADAQSSSYAYNIAYLNTNTAAGTGFYFITCTSGGYAANQFRVRGDGTIYAQNTTVQSLSDVRVKENIRDSDEGLQVILGLKPRRFDFKQGFGNDRKNVLGFIAQEIETVFPDAIDVTPVDPDGEGPEEPYKSVGPGALIPVLVKAIQEQQAIIEQLKADVAALKGA